MRFLVDGSLPRSAAAVLRELGHDAVDARDIGLRGATDEVIAEHARLDQLALITHDFDFADIRNYPPADYAGIVVLERKTHRALVSLPESRRIGQQHVQSFARHRVGLAARDPRGGVLDPDHRATFQRVLRGEEK